MSFTRTGHTCTCPAWIRDRVFEGLWPDIRPDRSSEAFHTILYQTRQMLRVHGEQDKFVQARVGEYSVKKRHFWIDADDFNYGQLGDRSGLAGELGVEPTPETQQLYRALLGGHVAES